MDLRRRKWWEAEEECIMKGFVTSTIYQILFE
jgi:hypothetical protein